MVQHGSPWFNRPYAPIFGSLLPLTSWLQDDLCFFLLPTYLTIPDPPLNFRSEMAHLELSFVKGLEQLQVRCNVEAQNVKEAARGAAHFFARSFSSKCAMADAPGKVARMLLDGNTPLGFESKCFYRFFIIIFSHLIISLKYINRKVLFGCVTN